jgi:predicted permease
MAWLTEKLAEFGRRISMLLNRDRFDAELEQEMQLHLELREQEKMQAGLSPEAAHYAAQRRFGNPTVLRERSHNEWGWQTLEHLLQDITFGLRTMLRCSPVLTLVAVCSLALGIGANTAIFSLLDALLLRNLPVTDPQQLVLFGHGRWVGSMGGLPNASWDLFSYPFYREFSRKTEVFSGVTAVNSIEMGGHAFFAGGGPQLFRADLVSGNYFDVLGVHPILGRALNEEDDRSPGAGPVAVASYTWWTHHGRDPDVVGKTLRIESTGYTLVGVAQPGFFGATVGESPDFWIPLSMEKEISPGWNGLTDKDFQSLYLIARLKPGVTVAQASSSTNLLFRQIIRSEYTGANPSAKDLEDIRHAQIELTPAARGLSQLRLQMSLPLEILMTVVGLVLLIACANIANLLLARGVARSREIAVRMALGATRSRLILQLLTESTLLACVGAILGVALAWKTGSVLLRLGAGQNQPAPLDVTPDLGVLLFTLAITGLTAILFGVTPALRATRPGAGPSLTEGRGLVSAPNRNRLGRGLIVAQISLSLVLLAGAGLFLRSLLKVASVDTGFDKRNVLVFGLDEYSVGLPPDERLGNLQQQIEDRVQQLPAVRAASFSMFTFNEGEWSNDVSAEGVPRTPENSHDVLFNVVGTRYFSTFGLPILAGRDFTAQDTAHSPQVALVNEAMQRRFFPGGSAIGHRFGLGSDPTHSGDFEIIGVVKDAKYVALSEHPQIAAYFPWTQHIQYFSSFSVRYQGDPRAVTAEVRQVIGSVNPHVIVGSVSTLADQVDSSIGNQQLIAQLSVFFSLLATLLVCIGIYGLVSYAVARRTKEIGVRMALGAPRSRVQWMVMREILLLAGGGLLIGIPVTLLGANLVAKLEDPHLMGRILFGVGPDDPASLGAAMLLMLAVASLAGYLPARRAARIDPMTALREE